MENKYYLAVETKPKNYFPINIADLKISHNYTTSKLSEIDAFTLNFTKEEIFAAIKEANLLNITSQMPLVVIYYEKQVIRKVEALTKDIKFDLWDFLKNNYNDKLVLNKVMNFLSNKVEGSAYLKLKNSSNLNEFLAIINTIPYIVQRKLYFYLYES